MDMVKQIQEEFQLKKTQAQNTVTLLEEGNTIPFIARYRKELTGGLDDQTLRELSERLEYIKNMDSKRQQIIRSIEEQEKMTDVLLNQINTAKTMTELEDIYRPFRPKRRTRASIAREKGLGPLALWIQEQQTPVAECIANYKKEVEDPLPEEEALAGALDIIAEEISDHSEYRKLLREKTMQLGVLVSKGPEEETPTEFEMYYHFEEPIQSIAPHRVLALNRGESKDVLTVKLSVPEEEMLSILASKTIVKGSKSEELLRRAFTDSYRRLIAPSLEREIRSQLTSTAEVKAIEVFGKNLKQLLLQPPIRNKTVLALDPAFRTGCKLAVIDPTGKPLTVTVIYPTPPQSKVEESKKVLKSLITEYGVAVIAIGNGTAGRESEQFVAEVLGEIPEKVSYVIVNEAGASVYSASKLGAQEFPDYDVSLRSAVSIGRRLQDPLAELVKIDPKSIGVGQYQHDMNQKHLGEALGGVVENCVNTVGVDLNTASPALLQYVAGISSAVSQNIVAFREENGKFSSRKELKKVPKLGPKAFEQCAGFLRIPEGEEALDNTAVHPESYAAAKKLLALAGIPEAQLKAGGAKRMGEKVGVLEETAQKLGVGVPTLTDIISELERPGRDPREDMPKPILRQDVLEIEDLKPGMILHGTVRNVIDFGAFIDIGVHQDGLVHISEISDRYIKHPLDVVSVGDIVEVQILSTDAEKKRIALTMKIKE